MDSLSYQMFNMNITSVCMWKLEVGFWAILFRGPCSLLHGLYYEPLAWFMFPYNQPWDVRLNINSQSISWALLANTWLLWPLQFIFHQGPTNNHSAICSSLWSCINKEAQPPINSSWWNFQDGLAILSIIHLSVSMCLVLCFIFIACLPC